jgi:Uma2 family endonuclease
MSQSAHPVHHTFDEYIRFERTSNVKHEYLGGQIYAMAGGTPEHAALAAAVVGILFSQLRGKPCRVYSSDLRVRAGELATYPDVTVVCGPVLGDPTDPNTALNPALVVEVTSPSTDVYDRGEKLAHYQEIAALSAIILVSQEESRIDLWRRTELGWLHASAGPGQRLVLQAIGCELLVDEVYAASQER